MSAPWSVTLTVAGLSWTVTNLDPATPGPTSPLSITESVTDGELFPAQPAPPVASFGLVASDAGQLATVTEGADVHITYTATGNPDPVTFDGTVTDASMTPHTYTDPATGDAVAGVRMAVTAVGYLAQLWEESIYLTEETDPRPLPGGGFQTWSWSADRLANLFSASQWPVPEWRTPVAEGELAIEPQHRHKLVDLDGEALGPLLLKLLAAWVGYDPRHANFDYESDPPPAYPDANWIPGQRYVIAPNLDPVTRTLDPAQPWRLDRVTNVVQLVPAAVFADTGAGWGVVPDTGAAAGDDAVIDAGMVERDIAYVQRKAANVNKVVIKYLSDAGKQRSTSASTGATPTVTHSLETDVIDDGSPSQALDNLAAFYLPDTDPDAWGIENTTWRLDHDVPGRLPPPLGALVTFAPVPATMNPNGRPWVTGAVASWTLTVADGQPVVAFELAHTRGRIDPRPYPEDLTWDELPATVTWDQLHAGHTWDDYRLLRGA
jgi:hypothetical protein